MVFEAHYSKWRLLALAMLGLGFVALGWWMAGQPASEFEGASGRKIAGIADLIGASPVSVGHGIGWAALVMGILVLPTVISNLRHPGPALRVDQSGILWHRWSDQPIAWSNIAQVRPYSIQRQKLVGLTLVDRDRNPPQSISGRFAGLNKSLGFGDLALTLQGTNGNYQALLDTLAHYHIARA
jgi:hypothetical protein